MSNETRFSVKTTFLGLGLAPSLLKVLEKQKFLIPTPIQEKAIPEAIKIKDIIGIAQTGTGKTLAFGLPLIQRLAQTKGKGLILLPTRELAIQVDEALLKIGRGLGLKTAILVGGASMGRQRSMIFASPHVIIGTPGRIIDHLKRRNLNLNKVNTLILDEADRMLDMGFAPQIKQVLETVPKNRQTMLFSATMPAKIISLASKYMKNPIKIEVDKTGTTVDKIKQELYIINSHQKRPLLSKLLKQYQGTVLVFMRTKFGASKLCKHLIKSGDKALELHSNRSFSQRQFALRQFKSGASRILVATDVASRGLDISNIELVVNYDMPDDSEDYVHRIGRTGRAGLSGRAISFVMPDQRHKVRQVERLINNNILVSKTPELEQAQISNNSFQPAKPNFLRAGQNSRRFPKRHGGQFNYDGKW